MTEKLTAQDWIDIALKTLAREGFDALKADKLARKLRISRGSFYWHFPDLITFHARVIEHWRLASTEAIITDIERHASPDKRLEALLYHAFGHVGSVEVRMRTWAENNAEAARAVGDIDRRRRQYIEQLLVDAGVGQPLATTRAHLLYWTYLGAALSPSRLTGEQLDLLVAELKQIGLGTVRAAQIEPLAAPRLLKRRGRSR
jgi:AcrR family transcriptional regulator